MWFDCQLSIVEAPDTATAARLGGVSAAAVRGPFETLDLLHAARRLRDAYAEARRQDVEADSIERVRGRAAAPGSVPGR